MNTDDTLHKTWEFKGTEIKPLSRARKFHLSKLVDFTKISPWDIAVLIFALSCDQSTLMKGLRNPEWFDQKVSEWIEKKKLDMADFNEESLTIIREVMEHSDENKAKPVADPNMMEDPLGNE
jgi:hypothetical protein